MWAWPPTSYVSGRPIAAAPGTAFTYNSGGNLLVADIAAKAAGVSWKDYARTALFKPLGITDWEWKEDFHGRPMAYTGLRMRPRDMAKLGRLVLNRGQWHGSRLFPQIESTNHSGRATPPDLATHGMATFCGRAR